VMVLSWFYNFIEEYITHNLKCVQFWITTVPAEHMQTDFCHVYKILFYLV
jgi:hypothetical protein